MTGWESSRKCVLDLMKDFKAIQEANKKDDEVDDDNDGIPDVQQIDSKALVTRKTVLFLKTVDPKRFSDAIAGLQSGFLAVLAVLKVQFAKAITLGNSIAAVLDKPANKFVLPLLEKVLPAEYKRWAEPVIHYSVRSFAVSFAWTVHRVISAFHSAVTGGVMAAQNVCEYCNEMKIFEFDHTKSNLDEMIGYALAFLGLWFQLGMGFQLPFIMRILLLPFTMAEWFLVAAVNRM